MEKLTLKALLVLEYLGIRIEDSSTEISDDNNFGLVMINKFSVPERSELEFDDSMVLYKSLADNKDIYSSDGLIQLAKETMIDSLCDEFSDDPELLNDFKNDKSVVKFYAKVRKGEVWNKELANARLHEILDTVTDYNEV